ncbi:MAG: HEAT repeat domain-containing protein, partial [Planctomycetota bacterium]
MRIAKKTSGIISLLIAGIFLISCSSNKIGEAVKPGSPVPESAIPKPDNFSNHLNNLIIQMGDYDYKKQESAYQEILDIINRFIKEIEKNPDYTSPELDYLRSALKDASEAGQVVDVARQSRALRLYALIKHKIVVHPDVLKLYPDILDKLESGREGELDVMDWLDAQNEDIRQKSIRIYKEMLKSSNNSIRYKSLEALLGLGQIEDVLYLLKDDDKFIRSESREIINSFIRKEGAPFAKRLLYLVSDNNITVETKSAIISAFNESGDKSAIKDLVPLFNSDDEKIRIGTGWAVLSTARQLVDKDPSVLNDIRPLLKHSDAGLRLGATRLIVGVCLINNAGDESIIRDIYPLLKDSDTNIRSDAMDLVEKLGDSTVLNDVLPLLQDSNPHIRLCAIRYLGKFGGKPIIDNLRPLCKDSDALVRLCAVSVLDQLGYPFPMEDILPLLEDPDANVRTIAVGIIESEGDKSHIAAILPLTKYSDPSVRLRLADWISKKGERDTPGVSLPVEDMVSLLTHPDYMVKKGAIERIRKSGNKSYIKDLLPLI